MESMADTTMLAPISEDAAVGNAAASAASMSVDVAEADSSGVGTLETPRVENRRASLTRMHEPKWGGVSSVHLVRTSDAVDIETGATGCKEAVVEEVTSHQDAMNPTMRFFNQIFGRGGVTEEDEEELEAGTATPKQYRLTTLRTDSHKVTWWQKMTGMGPENDDTSSVVRHSGWLTAYLRWTFRTSIPMLILSSFVAWWAICTVFAAIIFGVGRYQPVCIAVAGKDFSEAGIMDAYALSWTTFSTVGYGLVYPQLAVKGGPRCLSVNFLTTLEAFTGILFGGFMGAILFGKVARSQSFATVSFCDPIVLRYGTGVLPEEEDDSSSCKSLTEDQTYPCPVLEFRVANGMHSAGGGEIINANINVVASTLASKVSEAIRKSTMHKSHLVTRKPKGPSKKKGAAARIMAGTKNQVSNVAGAVTDISGHVAGTVTRTAGTVTKKAGAVTGKLVTTLVGDTIDEEKTYDPDESADLSTLGRPSVFTPPVQRDEKHCVVDEGSELVPRRIFSNLQVETPGHPFFKRVWTVRHVLDQNSPLLSEQAKAMIVKNGGFWPRELNSYQAVRRHIHFHEIIVNLSGTSNATGNTVYGQKVYAFADVNVGYNFVNMLARDSEGNLFVDMHLLNDVQQQRGGGGEPFTDVVEMDILDQAVGAAKEAATQARDKATEAAVQARDIATEAATQARDNTMEATHNVTMAAGQATSLTLDISETFVRKATNSSGHHGTADDDAKGLSNPPDAKKKA